MKEIKNAEQRPWEIRVSAAPRIPRGKDGYIESLRIILDCVRLERPSNEQVNIPGSKTKTSLDTLCVRLRPLGFVKQDSRKELWRLTEPSLKWLASDDSHYLASFINGNMKLFSEILALCVDPQTVSDLHSKANGFYKISWKDNAQIFDRLHWLIDLGLLSHSEFNRNYQTTPEGIEFLKAVPPYDWKNLEKKTDNSLSDGLEKVSELILNIVPKNQEELLARKHSIGYIPGSIDDLHHIILEYLELLAGNDINIHTLEKYSKTTYGIKESSTRTFLTHLTQSGLVERTSMTEYRITNIGEELLNTKQLLDLITCYHAKYYFVFEILKELDSGPQTLKYLNSKSIISYGFPKDNISEVRKRLSLLLMAKLIYKDRDDYHLSEKGRAFLPLIITQSPYSNNQHINTSMNIHLKSSTKIESLLSEVMLSSRDSTNPARFEKTISEIFTTMGFISTWIGGSGNTDVLLTAPTAPKFSYTVNIDAKATYIGSVGDGQVDFDTLQEHKLKHNADFVLIVGNTFESKRLINRAIDHNVGLLDINTLVQLVKNHLEAPVSFEVYKKFFQQKGKMDTYVLDNDRENMLRHGYLLKAIVQCLYSHGNDDYTKGILTSRDLYMLLKNDPEFKETLKLQEITDMLDFLSSPLITCVGKTKEGYYASGSLSDATQKFQFYINQLS